MRRRIYTRYLTHLSLFTGIGGIDLAAEAAGFATVGQVEWADFPTLLLEKHWSDVPRWRDIKTLTKEDFFERTGRKSIDLISGGFPCQPFSSAGRRRGFEDDRYLWPEMFRVVGELRPAWVLGENVAGFIKMGLDQTLSDLESAGYAARAFVLPACGVGAWHECTRTLIVGSFISHAPCQRHGQRCPELKCPSLGERSISQSKSQRDDMVSAALGSSVLPDSNGVGRISLNLEAGKRDEGKTELQSDFTDHPHGASGGFPNGSQPGLGGMADGVPAEMDGSKLWKCEPKDIPRLTDKTTDRANRLKALGNAVVPQQVYPILKAIADIETGRCKKDCFF